MKLLLRTSRKSEAGSVLATTLVITFVMGVTLASFLVLAQHQTFANARVLIPGILKWGFNGLWACEVNIDTMDYRSLRKEFGRDLRLIGGIDLDALRKDKAAIRQEIEEKVPPLIAEGGFIPLADGRVRADVPFENYVYYRQLLEKVTQKL